MESASLSGHVAEKAPTSGELPHQEKRELYTIRRVNTLASRLTEKGELESKSSENSNKEEQPMWGQVTHLETSLRGDPDCMLKLLKDTPNVNRGDKIQGDEAKPDTPKSFPRLCSNQ